MYGIKSYKNMVSNPKTVLHLVVVTRRRHRESQVVGAQQGESVICLAINHTQARVLPLCPGRHRKGNNKNLDKDYNREGPTGHWCYVHIVDCCVHRRPHPTPPRPCVIIYIFYLRIMALYAFRCLLNCKTILPTPS